MRVPEAAAPLLKMVRLRNGLAHDEPAALRSAAEEALGLLENRPSSARARIAETREQNPALPTPGLAGTFACACNPPCKRPSRERVAVRALRILALGGAFLETINAWRSVTPCNWKLERPSQGPIHRRGAQHYGVWSWVEFVHMKPRDRERLRRLIKQLLK